MVGFELTFEQRDCINRALEEHNFFDFRRGWYGKVIHNQRNLQVKGAEVQIVCSTGIACYVSLKKKPITVHSFLGIGTAQGTFDSIVEKPVRNPDVRRRIKKAKSVIWDECSMSSSRLLELYHKITTTVRGGIFGGIQTIIVGDWLQLKPVADKFDDGLPMFKSQCFSPTQSPSR